MATCRPTLLSDEHRLPQSSGISLDGAGLLTIAYADEEVRALLPTLPVVIEITAMVVDRNVDIVGDGTGRDDAAAKVLIEISSVFPGGISAGAQGNT